MDLPGSSERLGRGEKASAPARQRKALTGITPLARAGGKQVYRVAFSYRGAQCRETLALPHSKANEAYCARLRGEILRKIETGDFIYTDYFPDSPRAAAFGHGGRARTVRQALEDYRDRTQATLESSTWKPYRRDIENVLIPEWGDLRLTAFRPSDLRTWAGLQTVSLKRMRNILLPLRSIFADAVEDGLIAANPVAVVNLAKLVPIDKRTSDYEPQPYTVAELGVLLGKLPEPERWAFQLMAFTGLRTGELMGLRWPRVDLEAKTIRVTETTTERVDKPRAKTKAGLRTIPLLPAALEAIQGMRKWTQTGGDRVTVNPRARSTDKAWASNQLEKAWKAAHKGTGIAVRNPYQLRHTFASQLLSQGENPAYIAKLLGHKTIEMVTRTYGRWVGEGEQLGFDRPPRRFGMAPIFTQISHGENGSAGKVI